MRSPSTEKGFPQEASPVLSRAPEVVFCSLSDGAVLLNLSRGVYFGLDAVGTRIWELLQTPQSAAELTDALMKEYEVGAERCGEAVSRFLSQMSAQGLVQYEKRAAYE